MRSDFRGSWVAGLLSGWGRRALAFRPSYPATEPPSYLAERGLSLVEATIILGVMSMLTAVLAPSVRVYVQSAQQATAKKDVETLGSALSRMLTDTGQLWVVRDGNGAGVTDPPSNAVNNRVELLISEGKTPAVHTPRSVAGTETVD